MTETNPRLRKASRQQDSILEERPLPIPFVARLRVPALFMLFAGAIVSVAMALFPPFNGITGIEHAFVLTGPEWSQHLGDAARDLGLEPRIHWLALGVQLGVVWTITLAALWLFSSPREDR